MNAKTLIGCVAVTFAMVVAGCTANSPDRTGTAPLNNDTASNSAPGAMASPGPGMSPNQGAGSVSNSSTGMSGSDTSGSGTGTTSSGQ